LTTYLQDIDINQAMDVGSPQTDTASPRNSCRTLESPPTPQSKERTCSVLISPEKFQVRSLAQDEAQGQVQDQDEAQGQAQGQGEAQSQGQDDSQDEAQGQVQGQDEAQGQDQAEAEGQGEDEDEGAFSVYDESNPTMYLQLSSASDQATVDKMTKASFEDHVCVLCGEKFQTSLDLEEHYWGHDEEMQAWACLVCDSNFESKEELCSHLQMHKTPEALKPEIKTKQVFSICKFNGIDYENCFIFFSLDICPVSCLITSIWVPISCLTTIILIRIHFVLAGLSPTRRQQEPVTSEAQPSDQKSSTSGACGMITVFIAIMSITWNLAFSNFFYIFISDRQAISDSSEPGLVSVAVYYTWEHPISKVVFGQVVDLSGLQSGAVTSSSDDDDEIVVVYPVFENEP